MERIPVVDDKDEVIGYKNREELDYSTDIVRSSSLWITNSLGQVLLAQRKMTKKINPGKWSEAVGGTVENEDTYESTIYREAEEELGITNQVFIIGPKQYIPGPPANYFVQWYRLTIDCPVEVFTPQETEVEQVVWFDLSILKNDVKNNPDKYINELPEIIKLLS